MTDAPLPAGAVAAADPVAAMVDFTLGYFMQENGDDEAVAYARRILTHEFRRHCAPAQPSARMYEQIVRQLNMLTGPWQKTYIGVEVMELRLTLTTEQHRVLMDGITESIAALERAP